MIQTGDIVQLNSGGPNMTVETVDATDNGNNFTTVWVRWLNAGEPRRTWFKLDMLILKEPHSSLHMRGIA